MRDPGDTVPQPDALPDSVWRAIVEGASDGIFVTDTRLRIVWVNPRAAELLAVPASDLIGKRVAELVSADEIARAPLQESDLRAGRMVITTRQFRTGDGTLRTLEVSARLVGDGRLVGIARDATERVMHERTLARSEASFRALIENSPDGIVVHRGGTILYANPALARTLGWANEREMIGTSVMDVVHPDYRSAVLNRVHALQVEGAMVPFVEERLLRRDGTSIATSIGGMNVVFEGADAVAAVVRDVTEQRKLHTRMAHADRLTSLGVLAAGVAHEINNPLAYVMLRLEAISTAGSRVRREIEQLRTRLTDLLGEDTAAAQLAGLGEAALTELDEHVATAKEGAQRVRRIVQDLRVFSRADGGDRGPADVCAAMDLAVSMALHELRPRARITRDYTEVPGVLAGQGQLAQVFLNLLLNAAQAMETEDPVVNEVALRVWHEGGRVLASVRDTGRGISPEVHRHLFEPFFTTKPTGEGCGLGLAICDGIVSSLGGRIRVESREHEGSTFTVDLPAMPGDTPDAAS